MRSNLRIGVVCVLLASAVSCVASSAAEDYLRAKPDVVEAWKDMRFGMFLCWGPVSLTGKEIGWSRGAPAWGRRPGVRGGRGPTPAEVYDALYKKWKPDKFDAREWVKIARDAGMKYMIFLVKHHDGFCLYDTKLTDYKSTGPESAWKVDVMKQVADACHEAGLKLIVYYSQPDWHHPDYLGDNHGRYIKYLHGQIREILTNYGRIDGLWFDNLRGKGANAAAAKLWDAEGLFKMARSIQPHLIINDRCGLGADYDTPEQHVGLVQMNRPWESCITLGTQWAWKPDDSVKSLTEALHILVSCAVGDGNLALNTNPMPDGQIESRQAERFRQMGKWLKQYGESIYGTRGGPFVAGGAPKGHWRARDGFALPPGRWWGGSTHKGKTIYLHILRWPGDAIDLPTIDRKIVSYSVLTGGEATVKQTDKGITVSVPTKDRHEVDTIVKLVLDGPAAGATPGRISSGSLAFGKKATASNVFKKKGEYGPDKAIDDDPSTRWGCDWGTKSAWLEVDLGEARTLGRAFISEPYDRVQKFELQAHDGKDWRTFHRGKTIGENHTATFPPVKTRRVRLNLLETTDGPSIWEFQLFGLPEAKPPAE
jgi:alpha-L-fucosidase